MTYPIGDGKYVVFKVEDFFTMMGMLGLPPAWGEDGDGNTIGGELDCAVLAERITDVAKRHEVGDATVIRDQDVLSASTLDAYSDAALIVADILVMSQKGLKGKVVDGLLARAEFFRARAQRARECPNKKIPD